MDQVSRYFKITTANSGMWMGDGSIAYVDNSSGAPQIWRIADGKASQLTNFTSAASPAYSPKGTADLYFTMDMDGNENEQIYFLPAGGEVKNLTANPKVRHQFGGITPDGKYMIYCANARVPQTFDVFRMELESGKIEMVLENNDNYNFPAALSPDGKYYLYTKLKSGACREMWMLDLDTRKTRQIPFAGADGRYSNPAWKKDCTGFYLTADYESDFLYTAYYDIAEDKLTRIYEENWDVELVTLSEDQRYLAMKVNDDGRDRIVVVDLRSGNKIDIPQAPGGSIMSLAWNGHRILFSLATTSMPYALWLMDIDEYSLKKITENDLQGFEIHDFGTSELRRFNSFDGLSVPYFIIKPHGAQYPLRAVIDIHGGPEGQTKAAFSPLNQYLLSMGIAIILPNVRGSIGYGTAYQHLDDVGKRLDSVKDAGAMVEHLIKEGIVRADKVAVMGASYGGYMTLSCITQFPNMFAAAVDTVGMSDLETFLENTADYRRPHREAEYGSLAHHRAELRAVSPIHKADEIVTPLMVIHGANDPRVPVTEADQIVARLRGRGVEVEYLRYPDEGHGLRKLKNMLDCYPKVAAFLNKHLGD